MSKASRQRLRKLKQRPHRNKFRWLLPLTALVLIFIGVSAWIYLYPKQKQIIAVAAHDPLQPRTLNELLALSPEQIEKVDIGLMNLLCAENLSGSENLGIQTCLKKLDGLTQRVKTETQLNEYRFNEHPEQFRNSLGYYRMMILDQVLVQDLGIQYNPALAEYLEAGKIPTHGVFSMDSKNLFIHGLLNGSHYGTCASMPVLVVAVGRRLGYPLNLAGAKLHLYARYEDYNGKHFNIEPTVTEGFLTPSDEEYKTEQFASTAEETKDYGWLRPYSNQEILSEFLGNRGNCLGVAKRYEEAREMDIKSASYAQDTPLRRKNLQLNLKELDDAPLGDKIDDWRKQIVSWEIPQGAREVYFENRKIQIRYFVGMCPDVNASQRAVDNLKNELAEYARQVTLTNPAPEFLEHGQHILDLENKSGQELRLPAETLPPPLNRGITPQDYLNSTAKLDLQDEGSVMDALWQHYKDVTTDWSNQPPMLPQRWQEAGITFPISPLTGQ